MAGKKTKAKAAPRSSNKASPFKFDNWDSLSPYEFGRLQRNAVDYYYRDVKPAASEPFFFKWMQDNGYDRKQVQAAKKHNIGPMPGIYARILHDGCPDYNPDYADYWENLAGTSGTLKPHSEYLHSWAKECIDKGSIEKEQEKAEEQAKEKKYVPTIQERIRDQSLEMVRDIDDWLETWVNDPGSFDPKSFDFKKHFNKMQPSQAHARKMKSFYEDALSDYDELERMPTAGQLKKMNEHDADMWAQLKEGYAHLKKTDIKKFRTAINELMTELDFVIEQAKATRKPRKAKPKSSSKLVEKLKYCKTDEKYKLTSISPEQIVGANELWVFNVKTRKLGKYIAAEVDPKGMKREGSGLSVKGTTIIGFDEKLSVQKTVRKPEQVLKDFKAAGKVKLRKFLDEINAVDTKLNGRCNPDTVLLKVG
jgi:hypothetical protein